MIVLAWIFALVALTPVGLYVMGRMKDPFHPLIFIGTVSFSVVALPFIRYPDELALLTSDDLYVRYILFSFLCLLASLYGWRLGGQFRSSARKNIQIPLFNGGVQLIFGILCCVIGVSAFIFTYQQWDITGYLRDLGMLWITAAILMIQIVIYSDNGTYRIVAVLFLVISLIPPVDRFLVYGQRGDTFRIAVLVMLAFFCLKRRPAKPVFLAVAIAFAAMMATLQTTRESVNRGDYPDRVTALMHVVPDFFKSKPFDTHRESINTGTEVFFGAVGMEACVQTGRFGYGTGPTTGLIGRFLPKDLFDKSSIRTAIPHAGYDSSVIQSVSGKIIAGGAAPSGFANSFFELGWFGWIFWMPMTIGFRMFWDRAVKIDDFRSQGYMAGYFMAMLYAITQDIITAEVNIVYVLLPLYLIYKVSCRQRLNVVS